MMINRLTIDFYISSDIDGIKTCMPHIGSYTNAVRKDDYCDRTGKHLYVIVTAVNNNN